MQTKKTQTPIAKQRIAPVSYIRALFGGHGDGPGRFRKALGARLGAGTFVIPVGRARAGIYLQVKHAIQSGRRKVLMSPYTIPDLVTMVVLGGGEPVFYDFEPDSSACDLGSLRRLIDRETACVLVTHYHLNEPRLPEIRDICEAMGARLFDDCALALGGSIDGRPVGTLTDGSVFSLSSFKLLNAFWGGFVSTRDARFADFVERATEKWPRLRARDYLRPAARCLQYDAASRPLLFSSVVFPALRRRSKASGTMRTLEHARLPSLEFDHTLASRPSIAALSEWNRKLGRIDEWLAHRRAIASIYKGHLGSHMVSARHADGAIWQGSCFNNFPVVVGERREEIVGQMMLSGFDVGRNLYPNVHAQFPDYRGESTNIERLTRTTIYLPTHLGVTAPYARDIAAHLACII